MNSVLKNLTLRQISFYISTFVWITNIILLFALSYLSEAIVIQFRYILLFGFASFVITYYIIIVLFEKFVFRKIKLIYKFITNSKNSLASYGDVESSDTTLEQVNESVKGWAEERDLEISTLKSLESYRKNFVGDISHELKTPLFSIQGYLHTLLDGGMYDEKINRKYLERAAKNSERLQLIVEDLEMINKLEAESTILELEKFNLKEMASEVMTDMEVLAADKNINLEYKQGADNEYFVEADKAKIRQVFVNLLSNSFKYGIEGGRTKISFYDMDTMVLVEVSDNGIGIEDIHLKHLFDRFYRADKSRARKVGGSGLGLSIAKHILEAHDQKITVRSTIDKGSTFGFTLKKAK